jgi:hypothetical protein
MKERVVWTKRAPKKRVGRDAGDFSVPVGNLLKGVKAAKLSRLLVIGVDEDGKVQAWGSASTKAHLKDFERFKKKLDRGDYSAKEAA